MGVNLVRGGCMFCDSLLPPSLAGCSNDWLPSVLAPQSKAPVANNFQLSVTSDGAVFL